MVELPEIPLTDEDLYGKEREAEEPVERWVIFRLEDEWYAMAIQSVREIVRVEKISFLPSAPFSVAGVINLRGNIVMGADLKRLFALGAFVPGRESRLVVIEANQGKMGFLVDEVEEVAAIPLHLLEEPLPSLQAEKKSVIRHVCRWEGRLTALLDTQKLVDWICSGDTILNSSDLKSDELSIVSPRPKEGGNHV